MKTRCLTGLVAAAGLSLASSPAFAFVGGTCSPDTTKYAVSTDDTPITTSSTYKNVTEGTVNFTQGGTKASCIIVRFSAVTATQANNFIDVRAMLDGVAGNPDWVQFSGSESPAQAHAFDFLFEGVAPGSHSLRMQYRSAINGQWVELQRHTTIVQYTK